MDGQTKFVLWVIALGVWVNVFVSYNVDRNFANFASDIHRKLVK